MPAPFTTAARRCLRALAKLGDPSVGERFNESCIRIHGNHSFHKNSCHKNTCHKKSCQECAAEEAADQRPPQHSKLPDLLAPTQGSVRYAAVIPPSTTNSVPVTQSESSLAR